MQVVDELLASDEPSVRWIVRVGVLGEPGDSPAIRGLREQVRDSARARDLLGGRDGTGRVTDPKDPYSKWRGAHWVLLSLAELGYPAGTASWSRPATRCRTGG